MKSHNEIIKTVKDSNSETKLYKRLDNSFFIIKRDLNGNILKSKMSISYGDNSITNKFNALKLFKSF